MASIPRADALASQRIVAGLRAQILAGDLEPGARIRQEDLAERFGASRLPVREALRLLEAEGLVRLVANTGAWVARLSLTECTEAYLIRERLEPLLLAESIPSLSEPAVSELDRLADAMEFADLETFLVLDRQFHMLSFSGAASESLAAQVRRLWNTTQHYRRAFAILVDVTHSHLTHHEHHLIVDAISRRDPQDAEALAALHIRRTRKALAEHPELFDVA
ncbi:GntR family transcriptional regulator [Occultella kanbiaonis]|uniref:GntR family transcriptional regulator n=1 Tax=Occultella kanbiaonis TaxID=2675754 RepID=UPI0012B7EE59|nr:GntR family transcriptional regulator [Occultella kanbiaonis]